MADNKKWFKLWNTMLIDSISIPNDHIGMFCILGCLVSSRGENGVLKINEKTLFTFLKCDTLPTSFINSFNIIITPECNGDIAVTFKNWNKYQLDSTGYERQKRFRERKSVTGKVTGKVTAQEEEKEEDKNKKKNKKRKEKDNTFYPLKIKPDWIGEKDWEDLVVHRKKKRAVETQRAYDSIIEEIQKAVDLGFSVTECINAMTNRSWTGFKSDWMKNTKASTDVKPVHRLDEKTRIEMGYLKKLKPTPTRRL